MFKQVHHNSYSTPLTFVTEIHSLSDDTLKCKTNQITQMITQTQHSVNQIQLCIPPNDSKEILTNIITQYQQKTIDLEKENQRLLQLHGERQMLEKQITEDQNEISQKANAIQELQLIFEDRLEETVPYFESCQRIPNEIQQMEIHELMAYRYPPQYVQKVLQATVVLLRQTTEGNLQWDSVRRFIHPHTFAEQLRSLDLTTVPIQRVNQAEQLIAGITHDMVQIQGRLGSQLYRWIKAASNYIRGSIIFQPMIQQQLVLQEQLQQQAVKVDNATQQCIENQEQQQVANRNIQEYKQWLMENNQLFLQSQFSEEAYQCLILMEQSQLKLLKFMEFWEKMTSNEQMLIKFIDISLRLYPAIINRQNKLFEILSTLNQLDKELIYTQNDQTKQQLQSIIDFKNDVQFKVGIVKILPLITAHTYYLVQQKVRNDTVRNTLFEQIANIYQAIIQNNQYTHSIQYICGFISEVQQLLFKEFPSYYYDLGNVIIYDNLSIIDYLIKKVKLPQASSRLFQTAQFIDINQQGRVYKEYQLEKFANLMGTKSQYQENKATQRLKVLGQMTALEHKIQSHMKRISKLPRTEENSRILMIELSNCQSSIDDLESQLEQLKIQSEQRSLQIQQTQIKLKRVQGLDTLGFPIKRNDTAYISAIQIPSYTTYCICMQLMILIGKPTEWDKIQVNIKSYYDQIVKTKYENINKGIIEGIKLIRIKCSPTKRNKDILNQIDYWLENVVKNYEIYSSITELKQQLELEMETSQSIQLTISNLNEQLNLKKTEQASLNEINSKLLNRITKHRQLQTCYQTNQNHANRVLQQIELNRKQEEYNQQYIEEFNNFQVIQQLFEYTSFDWRTTLADRLNFVHPDLIQHMNQSISKSDTEPSIIQQTEISKLDIEQLNLDLRRKEITMYLIKACLEEYHKLEEQFVNLFKGEEQQSYLVKLNQQSYREHKYDSINNNKLIMFIVEVIIILWKYGLAHEVNDVYPHIKIINRDIRLEYAIGEIEQILQTYFKKAEDNTLTSLEFMRSILKVLNQDNNVIIQIGYEITLQLFKIYEPDIKHNITQSIPSINQAIKQYFKVEQMLE